MGHASVNLSLAVTVNTFLRREKVESGMKQDLHYRKVVQAEGGAGARGQLGSCWRGVRTGGLCLLLGPGSPACSRERARQELGPHLRGGFA